MQINKLEEDARIQEKRITDFINFEKDNFIRAFNEKKRIQSIKKKIENCNYH